jgi:hypothetical protein
LWSKVSKSFSDGMGIAADNAGNVVVSGDIVGGGPIGLGGPDPVVGAGLILVKLGPDGTFVWGNAYGGGSLAAGGPVALDADGAITMAGDVTGPIDFGGGVLTSGNGDSNVVVASFEADGNPRWARRFDGVSAALGSLATDPACDVIVNALGTKGFVAKLAH